jgi:copper oxidase (laccase) domain-containing protein
MKVAVGPSIGPCHFEVGADVAHQIVAGVPEKLLPTIQLRHPNPEKKYVDLRELARYKLLRLGIAPQNLTISKECTHCDPSRYYSFRRDGDKKGQRLEALIVKPRH